MPLHFIIFSIPTVMPLDTLTLVDTPALAHAYHEIGYVNTENVFESGDDPHHFALRPSMIAKINSAERLIYSGQSVIPQLEEAALSINANIDIQALDQLDENFDPHYWISPNTMADILMKLAPDESRDALIENLNEIGESIAENTYPYSIITDHEAYNPFIKAYGITYLGSLTDAHDHSAGAQTYSHIESQINAQTCFISSATEPNVKFEEIARSKGAKVVRHDVLGWNIEGEGLEFFKAYYEELAQIFSECAI